MSNRPSSVRRASNGGTGSSSGSSLARHPNPPSAVRQLLDHRGARPPLFGRPSVPDPNGPVGEGDRTRVMADQDDAGAVGRNPREQVVDLSGRPLVQLTRRLVGEQELRSVRDSGTDRHFLCLTPGQSLHRTIQQVIDLQQGTGVTSAPLRLRLPNSRQAELQRDILHHRQLGQ